VASTQTTHAIPAKLPNRLQEVMDRYVDAKPDKILKHKLA